MSKRLRSVTLELFGVQRDFEFNPPVKVLGEDELEVGREVLSEVLSLDLDLSDWGATSANVEVAYTIRGRVSVELEAFGSYDAWDDEDDIIAAVHESDDVVDAIQQDVAYGNSDIEVDDVSIESAFNAEGEEVEF